MTAEGKEDHTATTVLERVAPIWAWIRRHISPAAAVAIVATFAGGVAYVVHAQHAVSDAQRVSKEAHDSVDSLQRDLNQVKEDATKLRIDFATTQSELAGVAKEVDDLKAWRDRLEQLAESPPHATTRRLR